MQLLRPDLGVLRYMKVVCPGSLASLESSHCLGLRNEKLNIFVCSLYIYYVLMQCCTEVFSVQIIDLNTNNYI